MEGGNRQSLIMLNSNKESNSVRRSRATEATGAIRTEPGKVGFVVVAEVDGAVLGGFVKVETDGSFVTCKTRKGDFIDDPVGERIIDPVGRKIVMISAGGGEIR